MIWVLPKNRFGKLAGFAKVYAEFAATATLGKGWRAAADKFAEDHILRYDAQVLPDGTVRGGHWGTSFAGIRAKTMRHELDHVKFAVKGCQDLLDNFRGEVRKVSGDRGLQTPRQRIDKIVDALMGSHGFPYFDVGALEHKDIAKRDCYFMVAWYQRFVLKMSILDHIALEANLAVTGDLKLDRLMSQLGEVYPWV
jgi:hypothetical protein